MTTKWAYEIIRLPNTYDQAKYDLQQAGNADWEVVSIILQPSFTGIQKRVGDTNHLVILKKPMVSD